MGAEGRFQGAAASGTRAGVQAARQSLQQTAMHDEPKSALKRAILESLPVLSDLAERFSEPYPVLRKRADGGWRSEDEQRPDLARVYFAAKKDLEEAAAPFAGLFVAKHPEYDGLVGLAGFGKYRICHSRESILRHALGCLWNRHGTFRCDEATVDAIVEEFAQFVDRPTVQVRFQAQLLNFSMAAERLVLPDSTAIRRLSEHEVSDLYGGPVGTVGLHHPAVRGIDEYVLEGEEELAKLSANSADEGPPASEKVKARLDKPILCLRTFKEGHVGYSSIHFTPVKFCPVPLGSYGFGDRYVPFGRYEIAEEEVAPLREYARLIFAISEPAMEMACARLADAETRTRPQDRIVDAVIGMEALLLAGLGREDRRGELRYRFALHYSTLYDSPEDRYRAFRVAKHLYDLRSAIAHGSSLKDHEFPVGDEKLKLAEAGSRAVKALRWIIRRFLPDAKAAPYKRPDYWERAYFCLAEGKNH